MTNTFTIVLVSALTLIVIILLIVKNKKDKKLINPDTPDSVDETIMDNELKKE